MSATGRLAVEYGLSGDEPELLIDTIIDTECAIREWAAYLEETGRRLQ
ncbi:MAG: hypothetical protein PGN27_25125 [Mycolicibacterium neoaurum]